VRRKIIVTADGSATIHLPDLNESYHSRKGAMQESRHVFLAKGISHWVAQNPTRSEMRILEYGFGTGLNALLTAVTYPEIKIDYHAIEAFPIHKSEVQKIGYGQDLDAESMFKQLHDCQWNVSCEVTDHFHLTKHESTFEDFQLGLLADVIYYDAFGPRVHPEAWTVNAFAKAYELTAQGGVLTTYCAAGKARRSMIKAGYEIEKLEGPPGKREMLRATKPSS
jgi:tRNA U34 5-methylaminomethyl-2-thiouridine-forming methyltransferase MnmC